MGKAQALSSVFSKLFKELGIDKTIKQNQAVNLWAEVVGERIAEVSTAQKIENGILFVSVESPVWRNELSFMKEKFIKNINKALKNTAIKDIRFI